MHVAVPRSLAEIVCCPQNQQYYRREEQRYGQQENDYYDVQNPSTAASRMFVSFISPMLMSYVPYMVLVPCLFGNQHVCFYMSDVLCPVS